MATRLSKTSPSKGRVPYHVLHNLSTVDILYEEKKKSRHRTVGVFEAERLIARRKDGKGSKYLVKWRGFSSFENTWEPEEHISIASLRYFSKPCPPSNIIEECVDRLRREVVESLKHKWPEQRVTLEFRHDVFNFLFSGKGKPAEQRSWTLFEKQDFSKCKFPLNWNYLLDVHGDGVQMRFPVKMRTFLGRTPKNFQKHGENIVELPRAFTEKISVIFIKIPASC